MSFAHCCFPTIQLLFAIQLHHIVNQAAIIYDSTKTLLMTSRHEATFSYWYVLRWRDTKINDIHDFTLHCYFREKTVPSGCFCR